MSVACRDKFLNKETSTQWNETRQSLFDIILVGKPRSVPWASYQIRKSAGSACAGNAGNVFPTTDLKGNREHHGTCLTHVPWCMTGSLTRGCGENVPGIPGACATHNFRCLARGPWGNIFQLVTYCSACGTYDLGLTASAPLLLWRELSFYLRFKSS